MLKTGCAQWFSNKDIPFLFFFFFKIYLFLATLGLHCHTRTFPSHSEPAPLSAEVWGFLIVVASLVAKHRL